MCCGYSKKLVDSEKFLTLKAIPYYCYNDHKFRRKYKPNQAT